MQTLPVFNITLTKRRCKYDNGTCYWAINDWKGSTRSVVSFSQEGNISALGNAFIYPSGVMASAMPGSQIDRRHQDKRWISDNGLNLYDNLARYYDPILGRFYSTDALASKHPELNVYHASASNPARFVDNDGNDHVIMLADDAAHGAGHISEFVQDEEGRWRYYSKNGYGKPNNDGDIAPENLVQLLLEQTEKSKSGDLPATNTILDGFDTGYRYTRWMYIESSQTDDAKLRETLHQELNESYSIAFKNCSIAVSKAESKIGYIWDNSTYNNFPTFVYNSILESVTRKNKLIMHNVF